MSLQEEKREAVKKYFQKLIESITGIKQNDKEFQKYEENVMKIMKSTKTISVNSYEVKSKIDAICEKFIYENLPKRAENLKKLTDFLINHPSCKNYNEVDFEWSILSFLLSFASKDALSPDNEIADTSFTEILNTIEKNDDCNNTHDKELIHELREDFLPVSNFKQISQNDSELSEWSELSDSSSSSDTELNNGEIVSDRTKTAKENIVKNGLLEPQRIVGYSVLNISSLEGKEWLKKNTQNLWWMPTQSSDGAVQSKLDFANFCKLWNERSQSVSPKNITTISEYNLLCEILFMFYAPTNCKAFLIEKNEIKIQDNISIASVTLDEFKNVAEHILPYINMMNNLQIFIKNTEADALNSALPKTYEYYAIGLRDLLETFYEKLLHEEKLIKNQSEIYTIIHFINEMKEHFQYLEKIFYIHKNSILNYKNSPAHICSAFLLTKLLSIFETSINNQMANLSISLFLSSIKAFCYIIDTWWTDGRLDDWQNEFLIDRSHQYEEVCCRLYKKSKEKSFFVSSDISSTIQSNQFFKFLMNYSLEAGCTLNLLSQINKIGHLRNKSKNYQKENLYDSFLNDVLVNVEKFKENKTIEENIHVTNKEKDSSYISNNLENINNFLNGIDDNLLKMVFELKIKETSNINCSKNDIKQKTTKNIFDYLNSITKITILPLKEIICKSFSNILQFRISWANEFVLFLYHNEYEISKHLQNIRRVYLLESSDLMQTFYIKLFKQIESGKNSLNPFILTIQLDDIISSKYPEMSSLYRIEINSNSKNQTNKVIQAIDQLMIKYNLQKELRYIINETNILQYNNVFKFLLKIKWCLWVLENLKFSKYEKNRLPYAEFQMNDFLMRRLEQIRFWIMYAIQCIHFYLMIHVVQVISLQFSEKLENCKNLAEIKATHEFFIKTLSKYCFLNKSSQRIRVGIEQFLNLIYVLQLQWTECLEFIKLASEYDESYDEDRVINLSKEIDDIEQTYIRLHQYLAKVLNDEVYNNQQTYLSELSAAFNTSVPY